MTIKEFIEAKCKNIVKVTAKNGELLKNIIKGLTGEDDFQLPVGEFKDVLLDLDEKLEEELSEDAYDFIQKFIEEKGVKKKKTKKSEKSKKVAEGKKFEELIEEKRKERKTPKGHRDIEEILEEKETKRKPRRKKEHEEKVEEEYKVIQSELVSKVKKTKPTRARSRKKEEPETIALTPPGIEESAQPNVAVNISSEASIQKKLEEKEPSIKQPIAEIIRDEIIEEAPPKISQVPTKEEIVDDYSRSTVSGTGTSTPQQQEEIDATVILPDGTRIKATEYDESVIESHFASSQEEKVLEGTTSKIESIESRTGRKYAKPPVVPDPEIVERVKRESEEKLRKKKEKKKPKGKAKLKGGVVEKIDKEKLFKGGEYPKFKPVKKEKEKKKYKFEKYDYLDEEELQKEAEEADKVI